MGHEYHIDAFIAMTLFLYAGRDADPLAAEEGADLAQHPGLVERGQPQIVASLDAADVPDRPFLPVRESRKGTFLSGGR